MKIYIAGKITGDPDYRVKFAQAELEIARKGHVPVNPAQVLGEEGWTWEDFMRETGILQSKCAASYFLPDWTESRGARLEHEKALRESQVVYYDINAIPGRTGLEDAG